MSGLLDRLLNIQGPLVYLLVGSLVFVEDALFVGFVIPGESAAVLGGVAASLGHVQLWVMVPLVVLAAILGDTVGYEVGRHFGPRILSINALQKRRRRLDEARDFLRRRGGSAVLLGRFVAFFRAVMPALAGTSRMPYLKFLAYNAAGGLIWGTGFVLLGYLAGNSYAAIEQTVGRWAAVIVLTVAILAVVIWRIHKHRTVSRPVTAEN